MTVHGLAKHCAAIVFMALLILAPADFVSAATYDATGQWYLSISGGWADAHDPDYCPLETDETVPATITQNGSAVVVLVHDPDEPEDLVLKGSVTGNRYDLSAEWTEEDGAQVTVGVAITLSSATSGSGDIEISVLNPHTKTICEKGMAVTLTKKGAPIGGGYDTTSGLWLKAVLEVPNYPVTLVWKEVGTDTTPTGDKVVSGYFYADPKDFAYGSVFNPEVFVKIYIAKSGWCNIAFNHVTVDPVTVSSAHIYDGAADKAGSVTLGSRLAEHAYLGVSIN